jgi:hypothetical protein
VDGPSVLKKDWALTKDAFDALLARLSPDREQAGRTYEAIRTALITFFECRGSPSAADQADETINRVARRLLEGTVIHTPDPASYFYGVARNVLKEHWEASEHATTPLEAAPASVVAVADVVRLEERRRERAREEARFACLERCLETLNDADRSLVGDYYRGEGGDKVRNRKALADRLRIGPTALRLRALRIREKLERCVLACMRGRSPSE